MKGEKRKNEFLVNKSGGVYGFTPLESPHQRTGSNGAFNAQCDPFR